MTNFLNEKYSTIELNRKILKQMNGTISYEQDYELTTNSILIPLYDKTANVESVINKDHESKVKKILIVDDLEDNRFIVKSFLKEKNVRLFEAENGEEGLKKLKEMSFDIVLMDIRMPIMDGITATRQYRNWEKMHREKRTPIIFLTAYLNDVIDSKELHYLVDDKILNKPFKKEELIKLVFKEN